MEFSEVDPHPYEAMYRLYLSRKRKDIGIAIPHAGDDYRVMVSVKVLTGVVATADGYLSLKYAFTPDTVYLQIWNAAASCGVDPESVKAAQSVFNARVKSLVAWDEAQQVIAEWNRRAWHLCLAAATAENALGGMAIAQDGSALNGHAAAFAEWVDKDSRARILFVAAQIVFELSFAGRRVSLGVVADHVVAFPAAFERAKMREIPAALMATARARFAAAIRAAAIRAAAVHSSAGLAS